MPPIVGNGLGALARAIAQEIGPYQLLPLTTAAADGFHAVSTAAIDTEAPTDRHSGTYLYSHGPSVIREQQRVSRGGFVGATGAFTVAKSFSAPPLAGTTMSLLGTMPWLDQDGLAGLRTCINRSAGKRWVVDRYPITSTGVGVDQYDLGAPWWMTARRPRRLYDPDPTGSGHPRVSSDGWRVVQDGETWVLELSAGYPAGEVFFLECEVPASARLYSEQAAAWSYTASPSAAMTADGDACLGTWEDAYNAALYEVFKQLAIQAGGTRKSYWRDRAAEQRAIVASLAIYARDGVDALAGDARGAAAGAGSGWPKGLMGGW